MSTIENNILFLLFRKVTFGKMDLNYVHKESILKGKQADIALPAQPYFKDCIQELQEQSSNRAYYAESQV